MNILIPHSWLTEFLETDAKPPDISECLSLCGPTFEKLEKYGGDWIYDIEVTTNRVDLMSVYGIAREATVILPRFGYKAKLKQVLEGQALENFKARPSRKALEIKIINNPKLCKRILAIKLENVDLAPSPFWLADRLKKVGQRPLNNAIDITNYVMWELGHPTHVFDYDRLTNKKIVVREGNMGETLITLDGIKYKLGGGEVVFDDGTGEIIDLPGIMGTANTSVTPNTKNVLLWIESIDAIRIRQASIGLGIRSQAAILNEKRVDPELGQPAILRAIALFRKLTNARIASRLLDIYPNPYRKIKVKTTKDFICDRLGIDLTKVDIQKILEGLEFQVDWTDNKLGVSVPSFRADDITKGEDLVEEVARIYGYHNLPSQLMTGAIPDNTLDTPFKFESMIKNFLKGVGGIEVYTMSLVSQDSISSKVALMLKNPLGEESRYLRTSLRPSLIQAADNNKAINEAFHLFEIANVYLPRKGDLPEEKMMLAGIFSNYPYREAKGVLEALLEELNINPEYEPEDALFFLASRRVKIRAGKNYLGQFGVLEANRYIYYEFEIDNQRKTSRSLATFHPTPKYPAQIEDLTLVLPTRSRVGEVIQSFKSTSRFLSEVELKDIYKDNFTFRISYQHPKKTLTDSEVEEIRNKLLKEVKKKFGASLET